MLRTFQKMVKISNRSKIIRLSLIILMILSANTREKLGQDIKQDGEGVFVLVLAGASVLEQVHTHSSGLV